MGDAEDPARLLGQVDRLSLPVGVVDLASRDVVSISRKALGLLGRTADEVVGRSVLDVVHPEDREKTSIALDAMAQGAIDFFHATRRGVPTHAGAGITVVWVRRLDLDGSNVAMFEGSGGGADEVSPLTSYLGREPHRMAVGGLSGDWKVAWLSSDITSVLGIEPIEMVGRVLLGRVRQQEVALVIEAVRKTAGECAAGVRVHLRDDEGVYRPLCLILTSAVGGGADRLFVLTPELAASDASRRVAELEQHLWTIAGEVEAAGILSRVSSNPGIRERPELRSLSPRQWDVLSRLLDGDRVPTIAKELSLSQSTVRNHVSAILKRFGVHSQAELLDQLRQRSG